MVSYEICLKKASERVSYEFSWLTDFCSRCHNLSISGIVWKGDEPYFHGEVKSSTLSICIDYREIKRAINVSLIIRGTEDQENINEKWFLSVEWSTESLHHLHRMGTRIRVLEAHGTQDVFCLYVNECVKWQHDFGDRRINKIRSLR